MVREKPSCRNERHADGRISDAPNRIVLLDANLQSRQGEAPVRIHAHERERPRPDRETTAYPNISWQPRVRGQRQTLSQHLSPSRSGIVRNGPSETQEPAQEMRSETADHDPTSPPHPSKIPSPFRETAPRRAAGVRRQQTETPCQRRSVPPRKSFRKTGIPQSGEIRYRPPFTRLAPRQGKLSGQVPSPPSSRFSTEDAPYPSSRRSTIAPFSGTATEDSACSERLSAIFADIPDVPSRRNDPPLSVSGKEPRLSPEEKAPPGHRFLRKTARSFRPVSRPEKTEKQTAASLPVDESEPNRPIGIRERVSHRDSPPRANGPWGDAQAPCKKRGRGLKRVSVPFPVRVSEPIPVSGNRFGTKVVIRPGFSPIRSVLCSLRRQPTHRELSELLRRWRRP